MKLTRTLAVSFAIGICLGAGVGTALARGAHRGRVPWTPPALAPVPPDPSDDIGTGERLLLVVVGDFPNEAGATAAGAALRFGDLRGFTAAPVTDFDGLTGGPWVLLSAFRTRTGAEEFASLARRAGAREMRFVVARYRGTRYIGLGQEERPDGNGPLIGPLPPEDPNRIR